MSVLKTNCLWKSVIYKVLRSATASLLTCIKHKTYVSTDF